MKNTFTLLFACLLSQVILAHNAHQQIAHTREWKIENQKLTIEGSFYLCKNDSVYIESNKHEILRFPVSALSKDDQLFVEKRNQQIQQLNESILNTQHKVEPFSFGSVRFLIAICLLSVLGVFVYKNRSKQKLKFMLPILASGIACVMYSFTLKLMKAGGTDPNFLNSAFVPFKPKVHTSYDSTYFYVESNGLPDHLMMKGITGWQQQFPIPQCYIATNAWSIPLHPVKATTPVPVNASHFLRGAIAVAANGIAIFNPYTNTGVDALLDGQLDIYGGHCGRADDYHYHVAPMFLDSQSAEIVPIAFALDGYAVYGNLEPDGSAMKALDANHGHDANGSYHYHGTSQAPYMIGNMVGKVTEDSTLQIIPQAAAKPIRPAGTPLKGAVITNCQPNALGNGYTLTYTLAGATDSVAYSWTSAGVYTFNFYKSGVKTTSTYNSTPICNVPLTTGLTDETILKQSIFLYPNPASEKLNIYLPKELQTAINEISIYNVKGELIFRSKGYDSQIDISSWSKGTYIVNMSLNNQRVSKKILVQ